MVLQFELTNENKEDYYILNWHTPFEGFASEFLEISYEGKPVPYKGILVKRGNPSAENYLPLLAESTISTLVVLNEVYDVSRPGVYCVKLDTALMDYKMKIKGKELQPTKLEDGFSSSIPLSSGCTLFVVEGKSINCGVLIILRHGKVVIIYRGNVSIATYMDMNCNNLIF